MHCVHTTFCNRYPINLALHKNQSTLRPSSLFMPYGQIISGPPGSGKTTYTRGLHEFLTLLKRRPHILNFDPGADPSTFGGSSPASSEPSSSPSADKEPPSFDVRALVDLRSVMSKGLGPNGALQWSFDYLSHNAASVLTKMKEAVVLAERERLDEEEAKETPPTDDDIWDECYLIVDFPGQVELYTHSTSASGLLGLLAKVRRLARGANTTMLPPT